MRIFTSPMVNTRASFLSPARERQWSRHPILYAITLISFPIASVAAQDKLVVGADASEVPSLPGEERAGQFDAINMDTGRIALVDRSFDNVVGVRLEGYRELAPAVVLEKGWLVSRRLGMGSSYAFRSGSSELVLNGVYAPRKDVRIQLSASQKRIDGVLASFGGADKTIVQTGMLSSVKKQWAKSRVLPEAGFTVFTARAATEEMRDVTKPGLEMGTLAGYLLKLAAVPLYRGRFEVSYQAQRTRYDHPQTAQWRDSQASTSVDYSQGFDDCSLLHGRLTVGPGLSRTDLRYQKGAFSAGFLQTRNNENIDRAIQFTYSVSLDAGRAPAAKCHASPDAPAPFRAIVDATTARSPFLPSAPLTRAVGPADMPS